MCGPIVSGGNESRLVVAVNDNNVTHTSVCSDNYSYTCCLHEYSTLFLDSHNAYRWI